MILISRYQIALKHLRTLLTLILTNSEVRKLLTDFSVIGRDLLAKGAAKTSELIAPTEEKLREVDQSAPHDQFITEGGRVAGHGETPILDVKIPGINKSVKGHPHEEEARVTDHTADAERPVGEYRDKAQDTFGQAKAEASSRAKAVQAEGKAHAQDVTTAESPEQVADEKKQGVMEKMRQLRVGP